MNAPASHWAAINEISFVAGMRLLFWVARVFGRWPFRVILYPVLLWYVATKSAPRRASRDYLQRVRAFTPVRTGALGVLLHFAAFAETILDKMLLWSGHFDTASVTMAGLEPVERCLRERRGAVIVCAHLGNLELCRVLSRHHQGLKLTMLVHTKHARAFNQLLGKLDPDSQLNLMQVTEMTAATAMLLADKVAQGEFIVIAGDRVPVAAHPRIAMVDFLGAPAAFPIGAWVLASVLQCPMFALFSMHRGAHHEISFEPLHDGLQLPRKGRDAALAALIARYAARLEFHCLRAPLQWFNFYDFWHDYRLEAPDAPR
jgi:predicted LPLAT superfamily acyltransferase